MRRELLSFIQVLFREAQWFVQGYLDWVAQPELKPTASDFKLSALSLKREDAQSMIQNILGEYDWAEFIKATA